MTATPISDVYVYVLLRADGASPFYIGMGRGDRWLHHERFAGKTKTHKDRIILKILASGLSEVPKIKLAEGLRRPEAIQLERDLIYLIGRTPNGPLVNLTAGGDGLFDPDETVRAKLREARKLYTCSDETRKKLSATSTGRRYGPRSPEMRETLRLANLGFKHSPEAIAKIAAASKGRKLKPDIAESLRQTRIGVPMPEHVKEALVRANTGRIKTPEEIQRRVDKIIGRKFSPEVIARMRRAQSNRSPETCKKLSTALKAAWVRRKRHQ